MGEKMGKGEGERNYQEKLEHLDYLPDPETISSNEQAMNIIDEMSVNNKKREHNLQEFVIGEILFVLFGIICIVVGAIDDGDITSGILIGAGVFLLVAALILLIWFLVTWPNVKYYATVEDDRLQDWYRKVCKHLYAPSKNKDADNDDEEGSYTPISAHRPEDDINK